MLSGYLREQGYQYSGESKSRFHPLNQVGPVELAVTSFGQRFDITPLQLITAVSAISNGGTLIEPRIVKQVENKNTGTVTEIESEEVRRVISEDTSKKMRDMMRTAVEGRERVYGSVVGYEIGGKTGTSEPPVTNEDEGYAVSYLAIAPSEEPEVIGLVVVYKPDVENPYGSRIAAPILSKILTDVLPYMGIASDKSNTSSVSTSSARTMKLPDVTNKTVTEAKKALENIGYKVIAKDSGNNNSVLVTEQVPAKGTTVIEGATVVLYTEENNVRTSVAVPKLIGKTLSEAKTALAENGLNISYTGSGKVVSQDKKEGEEVEQGTIITIKLE